jgi:hypothetical protein
MKEITKKYIIDENQKKIAVQISIEDYEKIEEILEDYALGKILQNTEPEDNLNIEEAKAYYKAIKIKK